MLRRIVPVAPPVLAGRRTAVLVRCTAAAERDVTLAPKPVAHAPDPAQPDAASAAVSVAAPVAAEVSAAALPPQLARGFKASAQSDSHAAPEEATSTGGAGESASPEEAAAQPSEGAIRRRRVGGLRMRTGGVQRQNPAAGKLRELIFLEDKPSWFEREVETTFRECISQGQGVVIRSLGRLGAVGAINFINALRSVGGTAEEQWDVSVRFHPQEPLYPYGTPIMMFVDPQRGRRKIAPEGLQTRMFINDETNGKSFMGILQANIERLERGQYVRIDLYGATSIYRGVNAVSVVREQMGTVGGRLVMRTRVSQEPEPVVRLYVARRFAPAEQEARQSR